MSTATETIRATYSAHYTLPNGHRYSATGYSGRSEAAYYLTRAVQAQGYLTVREALLMRHELETATEDANTVVAGVTAEIHTVQNAS